MAQMRSVKPSSGTRVSHGVVNSCAHLSGLSSVYIATCAVISGSVLLLAPTRCCDRADWSVELNRRSVGHAGLNVRGAATCNNELRPCEPLSVCAARPAAGRMTYERSMVPICLIIICTVSLVGPGSISGALDAL